MGTQTHSSPSLITTPPPPLSIGPPKVSSSDLSLAFCHIFGITSSSPSLSVRSPEVPSSDLSLTYLTTFGITTPPPPPLSIGSPEVPSMDLSLAYLTTSLVLQLHLLFLFPLGPPQFRPRTSSIVYLQVLPWSVSHSFQYHIVTPQLTSPVSLCITNLLTGISVWMSQNFPKVNPYKTEFLIFPPSGSLPLTCLLRSVVQLSVPPCMPGC